MKQVMNANREFLNELSDGCAVMFDGSELPCKVVRLVVRRGGVQVGEKAVVAISVENPTYFPDITEIGLSLLDDFNVFQVYENDTLLWETEKFPIITPRVSRRYLRRFGGGSRLMLTPQGLVSRLYDTNGTLRAVVKEGGKTR